MRSVLVVLLSLVCGTASAVDEYILPDAMNHVDLRHVKRATCSVVYYMPAHVVYTEAGGPGIGGSGAAFGAGNFVGGTIGSALGGNLGGRIGSAIGSAIGAPLSRGGGGKPPSATFVEAEMRTLGTGVVYAETAYHYYVLTAGHAIDRKPFIQFNYAGERSAYIDCKVVMIRNEGFHTDVAILKFPKSALGNYPVPTIIPLSDRDENLIVNKKLVTMRFGTVSPTVVTSPYLDTFQISAKIHKGISGSPVVEPSGRRLVGLVVGLDGTCIGYHRIIQLMREHNDRLIRQK